MTEVAREEILLIYDEQCPACDQYCRMVRIRESVGDLKLVSARDESPVMDEITALGWDIDQGMVLKAGDQLHYGSDAIHALSLMSSRSGVFNRFNYWMFKSATASRYLYPVFRHFRNLLLKILRVTKINNLGLDGRERF